MSWTLIYPDKNQGSIQRGTIRIKDLVFEYETIGSGIPMVMIHGFSVDRETMRGCMEPLLTNQRGWKRIYFDLPGMGKTKGVPWVKNSDDILEVSIKLIEKVIPNQKFLVVGESYGGYIARGLVYKVPQKVLGIALICPLAVPDDTKRDVPPRTIFKLDPDVYKGISDFGRFYFDVLVAVHSKEVWKRFNAEMVSGFAKADGSFVRVIRQPKNYGFSFPVDKLPLPFKGPSLILTGRQDSGVGYRDIWNFYEQYKRATFACLDFCGHALQIEQEKLFNALVSEWLDRVKTNI
jgi:pimeloyl-ACP methyl ester carboxylesterase